MTAPVLDTGRRLVDSLGFDARSASVGLVAVLLLAGLLVVAEIVRGLDGPRARALAGNLTVAIGPLLVAFAVIVGTRLGHLV
jgi:hypothetical protein